MARPAVRARHNADPAASPAQARAAGAQLARSGATGRLASHERYDCQAARLWTLDSTDIANTAASSTRQASDTSCAIDIAPFLASTSPGVTGPQTWWQWPLPIGYRSAADRANAALCQALPGGLPARTNRS